MKINPKITLASILILLTSCKFTTSSNDTKAPLNKDIAKHLSLAALNDSEQQVVCNTKTLFVKHLIFITMSKSQTLNTLMLFKRLIMILKEHYKQLNAQTQRRHE